jgi:hypothetical protein
MPYPLAVLSTSRGECLSVDVLTTPLARAVHLSGGQRHNPSERELDVEGENPRVRIR